MRVVAATNRDLKKMVEDGSSGGSVVPAERDSDRGCRHCASAGAMCRCWRITFFSGYNQRYGQNAKLTESGLKALEEYTLAGKCPPDAAPDRAACDSCAERRGSMGRRCGRIFESMDPRTPSGETLGGYGNRADPEGSGGGRGK